jgi:hypothetical protein
VLYKKFGITAEAVARAARQVLGKERTSFSEEKEAKRLLLLGAFACQRPRPKRIKVFWFFFSKKNRLLTETPPATT